MHHGLTWYCILFGGFALNADWVPVQDQSLGITDQLYSEAITTPMEAWLGHQKTYGNPSLIQWNNYIPLQFGGLFNMYSHKRNAGFGQKLKSFSQKCGLTQSVVSAMQMTFFFKLDLVALDLKPKACSIHQDF